MIVEVEINANLFYNSGCYLQWFYLDRASILRVSQKFIWLL